MHVLLQDDADALDEDGMSKLVLARQTNVSFDGSLDPLNLLAALQVRALACPLYVCNLFVDCFTTHGIHGISSSLQLAPSHHLQVSARPSLQKDLSVPSRIVM